MLIDYESLLEEYCKDVEAERRREACQAAAGQDKVWHPESEEAQESIREKAQEILRNEAELEQVYMGASMIHVAFPDVSEIEESVLNEFRRLKGEKSAARDIRKMAWSLKNVQHRRVTEENCGAWGVFENREGDGKDMVKLNFG